jgi:hypothetical protein
MLKFPFGNPFAKQELPVKGDPTKEGISGAIPDPNVVGEIDPATGKPKVTQKGSDNPLMDFTKLWEDTPIDPKNPKPDPNAGYLPKIDPAKLNALIGNMDFMKDAKPEDLAAIVAGGDGAAKAVGNIINQAVRQATLVGFASSQRLIESGLSTAKGRFLQEVPNHVKNTMIEDGLTSSNPFMADPEFGPMVESVRQQFQEKYPKATPKQIEGAVNGYFDKMHTKMTTKKGESVKTEDNTDKLRKGDGAADWQEWAGDELGSLFETGSATPDPSAQPQQ